MDRDITEVFENLIQKYREYEAAYEVFLTMIESDETLQEDYSEWCAAMGYSEKKGFAGFYDEYIERDDTIWDSIFPNREEYNDEFGKE
ncbi:hypothetical protein [Coprobacter tertius]|uniref:Uncharacterized protein n=1 Tax=Coprobacter tertius TaxID=2944915 RepID=A0ABT1MLS1_9BACT|nr:hypothetical protein [Coprobacter tertius]MCP9613029.1 hypothetical protein [Coprobacter tertius]